MDRYEEALERAKAGKPIDEVFPELKKTEDERIRKAIVEHFEAFSPIKLFGKGGAFTRDQVLAYLEKKKEQNPAELSEEDEDAIEMAIIALEDMYDYDSPNDTYGGHNLPFNEAAKRLKSLRPQPHWKPSEEQMKAMEEVRTIFHNHHLWDEINPILYDYEELMRDLKKLM